MKPQLILRAIVFTLLLPGVVTIYLPFTFLGESISRVSLELSPAKFIFAFVGLTGACILLHCIWAFVFYGKGTLAPIDPPTTFVVQGFYKYCRNPMYLAVIIVLLSETLFFQSLTLLQYTLIVLLCFNILVRFYEEPHLRNQFGELYLCYCRQVPAWGIAIHPYKKDHGGA